VGGTTIWQVIAIDNGDYGMIQSHGFDRISQSFRLIRVEWRRSFSGANGTESATACAYFSSDHERCSPITPTFVDVGALCLLTNRVQAVARHSIVGGTKSFVTQTCR